jgi:hypothetical protein
MNKKHYYVSDAKYLKLSIDVPASKMLSEAQLLKDRFTNHRPGKEGHSGWKGLTLYGLGEDLHESWQDYGYQSAEDAARHFKWTNAATECPETMKFLCNKFPCNKYGRVRLMLIEPGGWISPHSDTTHRLLENTNIPLSNPVGCDWKWSSGEVTDMVPGNAYLMNISYEHAVYNNSTEDRFHLIIARHDATTEWRALLDKSANIAGIKGNYVMHSIVV